MANSDDKKPEQQKTGSQKIWEFVTHSKDETIAVGRELVDLLPAPKLLLLRGDLGAGKTTLVKGIAEALDAADADEVTSPTFTLVHEYEGVKDGQTVLLYHLDVYRLEGERQFETLGINDLLTPDALVLVEWGEKIPSLVARADGQIAITIDGPESRRIRVELK